MPGHVLRKRIARKILLGYVVPLAVLLVAGLLVPILFWSYLSQADAEYDASVHAVDRANAMRRAAQDAESDLRGFVRYRDDTFRQQFQDAHDAFRDSYRDLYLFLDAHPNSGLKASLEAAGMSYRYWRIHHALPLLRDTSPAPKAAPAAPKRPSPPAPPVSAARALAVRHRFEPVQLALDGLITEMEQDRIALASRAHADDSLRLIIAVAVPTVAVLLAALIARLNTLGITRPLEQLTEAAETLEQGEIARVLVGGEDGPYPDDEIGDLQQAFRRMARTIGQREAVLRAQNEALGALNQRVEAVLNATNDGIVLLDRGGGFSVANARFAELFGIETDVLLDHTFSQAGPLLLSRCRSKEAVRVKFEEILSDPEAVADETFEIVEPHPGVIRMYSAPVRGSGDDEEEPELIGRIFVFRDVTRETALDRMKTEFVSTVSHELRTPLTAIKGYVDLIASGQTGPLTDVQREFLSLVQTSTRRLTALINDMLDISRIESGRIALRRESVDYLPLVRQTVRMMEGEANKKRIPVRIEVIGTESETDESALPHVSGDSDRITQVLVNLLSNSIKYTPAGGAVTVSVEFEGDFVTTCVADTGIGIGAEDQARLFQKFFRADNSTTREVGGTGLGLAITRAILEKLNGSIWVESELGKGSRFYFTLPTASTAPDTSMPSSAEEAENAPAAALPPPAPAAPFHPRRLILSIDSDLTVLHRLGHQLRHGGEYAISNAATPGEALRRARSLRPDLITLDPLTPGLDAFGLLAELQESSTLRQSPVALVTLRIPPDGGEPELRDDIALLSKPLDEEALGQLITRALRRSDAQVPTLLAIGDGALTDVLHRLLAHPAEGGAPASVHLQVVPTAAEAERFTRDPALSLIVLDTAAAPGTRAGRFAAAVCRTPESCRVPLIVLTDVPLMPADVAPLLPFGDGPAPLSDLVPRLEALLAKREPPAPLPL